METTSFQSKGTALGAVDWLRVKGFKSFRELERLELGRTNIIIGPNGAGKSNLIEVFLLLDAICHGRLQYYVNKVGGVDRILHFGHKVTNHIELEVSFSNGRDQYFVELEASEAGTLFPRTEVVTYRNRDKYPDEGFDIQLTSTGPEAAIFRLHPDQEHRTLIEIVQRRLREEWRLFHFHDTGPRSPMKGNANVHSIHGLDADGGNLAAYLFWLQQEDLTSYTHIRRVVRLVAPFFDDFVFRPIPGDLTTIRLEWKHLGSNEVFDVASMSDGMLRFVALTTLLMQPAEYMPHTILLDEPELGLHPFSIVRVGAMVQRASRHAQLIVATQSSQLLDNFSPEDVLVANREDDQTSFHRLTEVEVARYTDTFSLGELWERNQFGGCP